MDDVEPTAVSRGGDPLVVAVLVGDERPELPELAGVEFRCATAADLPAEMADADVLLVWDFTAVGVEAAVRAAERLRWIHVSSAGVDKALTPAARASDAVMTNTRGVLDTTIAEYVLGMLLALTKDLPGTLARQSREHWEHRPTLRLSGRRALVVGPGSVGRSIARLLTAAGVDADGVGRSARSGDGPFATVHAHTELCDVIDRYDIVVLAAPATEQTRGLIDARVLRSMRTSAYLVNIGRGVLVDEDALTATLTERRIAGAALDVFAAEPLPPGHRLWTAPNTIVSPHMAGDYVGWRDDLLAVFLDNLDRFVRGAPLPNIVDKSLGYVSSS